MKIVAPAGARLGALDPMLDPSATYVVQLTPPGRGAIATVRVEGPAAVALVSERFRARNGRPLAAFATDRPIVGRFAGERGEELVVRRCADNAVELHCHGGYATVAMIEQSLEAAGCRPATWREWIASRQSDPIAAAAIAALAEARTERTAAILLDQYHGALRRELDAIRAAIDGGSLDQARRQIDALRERIPLGQHLVRPWRVVLAGLVNVGKSSLLNALAGYTRAIVHHSPGTTRDAVTASTAIDGWPIELCDTAGVRSGGDPIERAGIQRAYERVAEADIVVLVTDHSTPWSSEEQALLEHVRASQPVRALIVHNKSDLAAAPGQRPPGTLVSALRGNGVDAVLATIASRLVPNPPPAGAAVPFEQQQIDELLRLAERALP